MDNFNKRISILVVISVIFIIFSSPLWASDETSLNETLDESQYDLEINKNDYVSTDDNTEESYSSLNNLIINNNIVELDKNYVYNSSTDSKLKNGISINKNVVIDGKGFTINSTKQAKLFEIKSKGSLTLKNIILLNDNPVTESGIKNSGKLILDNVTFISQKQITASSQIHGAIINDGELSIHNSNFKDSFINFNAKGTLYVYGMLIKNSGNLIIENTNITNNGISAIASTVQIHGGLIYNSGKLSLNKVNMSESYSRVKSSLSTVFGFILGTTNSSDVSVNNSHFDNNVIVNNATTNSALTNVIRIANGDLSVYNSQFINNKGSLNGGAIGYYSQKELIIENNLFDSNHVTIQGGAIFLSGNMKSNNNTFKSNFAGRNGGALYVYGYYDAKDPNLGNVVSTNDLFEYNYVESSPDAYGQASILSWGGAICSKAGNLNLTNDTFYKNKALMGDGGAIANYLSSWLQVSQCIFKENEATRWDVWTHASGLGGAILIPQTEMVDEDKPATFNIEYSIFDNNHAISGTALYSVPYQDVPCDFISNNNYWGSNNPFFQELISKYQLSDVVYPDNYIIMEIEGDDSVNVGSSTTYRITLNKVYENGEIRNLDNVLPDWEVKITSTLNSLSCDTVIIKNSEAKFIYDALKTGSDSISVNKQYYKKSITVVKYDSEFEIKYNNTAEGLNVDIKLSEDIDGIIYIKLNEIPYNTSIKNGSASITLPKLSAGNYTLNAYYSGNEKYNDFSNNVTVNIEKNIVDEKTITQNLSGSNIISVNLPADATGRVLFDIDGKNFYANVENGVASLDISSLGAGVKNINWIYLGDSNYDGMRGNFTITVKNSEVKITENKNIVAYYTDGSKYSVKLTYSNGKSLGAGKTVTFKINGKTIKVNTDKNGIASIKITQIPKKYTVTAKYRSLTVKNTIVVKKVLSAKNLSKKKAKKIKYTATVKGKTPFKGKKVTFKINGKTYSAKTSKKGIATIYLKNLKVGKHKIVIKYANTQVTKTIKIKK